MRNKMNPKVGDDVKFKNKSLDCIFTGICVGFHDGEIVVCEDTFGSYVGVNPDQIIIPLTDAQKRVEATTKFLNYEFPDMENAIHVAIALEEEGYRKFKG